MKKVLSVFLSIILIVAILPLGAFNLTAIATEGYYTYLGWRGKATITDVDAAISGDVVIPKTLGGYEVTSIGYSAFSDCTGLTNVIIPNSVTSIGISAFRGCTGLTSITIPNSVTSIGSGAFEGCTSLTDITLPFIGSSRMVSGAYDAVFGYIFGYTISSSETGTTKQWYSNDSNGYYYIPSSLKTVTITDATQIPYGAFYNCAGITHIAIPNGVIRIGGSAFCYCISLTSVTIPNSVTSIGDWAFRGCGALTDVWYSGRNKNKISFGSSNSLIKKATWHYNICEVEHNYFGDCDSTCNNCEWIQTATGEHSFSSICDAECDVCGETRIVPDHDYNDEHICTHCGDKYTPGDIDDNGDITLDDVVSLAQIVAGWQGVAYNEAALDVNRDGSVTLDDVVLLAQFVAGWDVTLS